MELAHRPTSIDLFSGAGGLSLGLTDAGWATRLASDYWPAATRTFEANFDRAIPFLEMDARDLTGQALLAKAGLDSPPDLVVGGPPCQGFSSAGARRGEDPRNTLVGTFARLIAEMEPVAFVFENVEGFLTAAGGRYVTTLLDPLIEAGYSLHLQKVNAANFGVPQLRKRVLAIGARGADVRFPSPTHRAFGAPGVHRVGHWRMPMSPTLGEALRGLLPAADGPPGVPPDHYARPLRNDDLARVDALKQGQTMRDLPSDMWHASYERRANRRVLDGTPTERRGGAPAGLRRLVNDEPSKAITSAASREFIHPTERRSLTLRECARLQTFPDSFQFHGSHIDKATLIGNAVPPLFAKIIGASILTQLSDLRSAAFQAGARGQLLSFAATSSDGKSPALREVTELIDLRYGVSQGTLFWSEQPSC